jgi:hypothetical protein
MASCHAIASCHTTGRSVYSLRLAPTASVAATSEKRMMMTKTISALSMASLLCLGSFGLAACDVSDEGHGLEDEDAFGDEELGEAEQALCFLLPNPTPDTTVNLNISHDTRTVHSPSGGYGSGECAYYSAAFLNGDQGHVVPYALPTNRDDCEGTTLRAQYYWKNSWTSAWTYVTTVTRTGVWSGGACTNLHAPYNPPGQDLQIRAQVRRRVVAPPYEYFVNDRVSITGSSVYLN